MSAAGSSPKSTDLSAAPDELTQLHDLAGDVQSTMALWQREGLSVALIWLALTGERRAYVGAAEIYGFMCRWAARPRRIATQLELPINKRGKTMSRIRSVHPSQWTDGQFATLSPTARLLLLGLRNEADDHGVFEWQPLSLKLRILPLDQVDIDTLLAELVDGNLVTSYESDGVRYGACVSWNQQPQHPSYRFPQPPVDKAADTSVSAHSNVVKAPEPSVSPHADSYLESESKSKGGGRRAGARAAPPPEDLPEDWGKEARTARAERGLLPADLPRQWQRFRDRFKPEQRSLDDWHGKWLLWADDAKPADTAPAEAVPADPPAAPPAPVVHQLGAAGDRLLAELGPSIFRGWFLSARVGGIEGATLRLVAPTAFVGNFIAAHYDAELRRAFGVERVEVVVASEASAAPIGTIAARPPAKQPQRGGAGRKQTELLMPVAGAGAAKAVPQSAPAEADGKRRAAG